MVSYLARIIRPDMWAFALVVPLLIACGRSDPSPADAAHRKCAIAHASTNNKSTNNVDFGETGKLEALIVDALSATNDIADADQRRELMYALARLRATMGDYAEAKQLIEQAAGERSTDSELDEALTARAATGDFESVRKAVCTAPSEIADEALVAAVDALLEQKNLPAAMQLAGLIDRGIYRSMALSSIGRQQAESGLLADAARTYNAIVTLPDRHWTAATEVLASIAVRQGAHDRNRARKTLFLAIDQAQRLPTHAGDGLTPRADAMERIAQAWAQIGSAEDTLKIIDDQARANPKAKDGLLLDAAGAAAEEGQGPLASTLLGQIRDPAGLEQSRTLLAELSGALGARSAGAASTFLSVYSALGDFDKAEQTLHFYSRDCDTLASAVRQVGVAEARSGHVERALQLIRRIPTASEPSLVSTKAQALHEVAATSARQGHFEEARSIADRIPSVAFERGDSQAGRCELLRGIVTDDIAKTDWRSTTNGSIVAVQRGLAYRDIAREMASRGKVSDMITWAHQEADAYARASILTGSAEGSVEGARTVPSSR